MLSAGWRHALVELPRTIIPLSPMGVLGIESLRKLGSIPTAEDVDAILSQLNEDGREPLSGSSFGTLIDQLAEVDHGVILAMGKGGVGKTTVAAAVATALAERGHKVHLSTTDPAAHVAATMAGDHLTNMTVDRIDPVAETASYSQEVLDTAGEGLDEQGKALLKEDLRSPCTEEIAGYFGHLPKQLLREKIVLSFLIQLRQVTRSFFWIPHSPIIAR